MVIPGALRKQTTIKVGCGRRSESDVWTYFKYDAVANRSKCIVQDNGVVCGKELAGKNPKAFFSRAGFWAPTSAEAIKREKVLTDLFISTGLPVGLVDNQAFRSFCIALDSRFSVPGEVIYNL
jgi:hypothetical protein